MLAIQAIVDVINTVLQILHENEVPRLLQIIALASVSILAQIAGLVLLLSLFCGKSLRDHCFKKLHLSLCFM